MDKFAEYVALITELDEGKHEVTKKEADFLNDLLERRPTYLHEKQVDWLKDMEKKYL